jgi:hypothetical protein
MQKFSVFLLLVILIFPTMILATVGAGVTTGEIKVKEPLKAGGIYQLPLLVVVNTGTEPSWYQAGIEYHMEQAELWPPREWFEFEPKEFYLESKEAQKVGIKLTVPVKAEPGDYFCYAEGRSVTKDRDDGTVRVGVAAGAKLYFTILPGNIWMAIYYRIAALWKIYSPWSWIVSTIILGALLIVIVRFIFKRFFNLQIRVSKK